MPARPRDAEHLTALDREFLLYYLQNGGNATKAYQATHPKVKPRSAATEGWKLLRKPDIAAALLEERRQRWQRIRMDADEALALVAHKGRASIAELFDKKGELLPVHKWPKWMARCVKSYSGATKTSPAKLTLHDGLKALELVLISEGKLRNKVDLNLGVEDVVKLLAEKTPA